jgi:hypothetical protein
VSVHVGASAGTDTDTDTRAQARVEVEDHHTSAGERAPDVATLLGPRVAAHCETYGQPIGPTVRAGAATPGAALGHRAFVTYVLEVMRREAGAEIALINRGAIKEAPFPITGAITRGELHEALPYRTKLVLARVPGTLVASVIGHALGSHAKLASVGIEHDKQGALHVNERPIDTARSYRVVTIDFLAGGGDEILGASALSFRPLAAGAGGDDLRQRVESYIRTRTAEEDGDTTLDPATDFGPPASRRLLTVGLADVGLDLASTFIDNPASYSDPQLVRTAQRTYKGELGSLLRLRTPLHELDAKLAAKYGFSRTQAQGKPATSGETTDLVTVAVTYSFAGLRHTGGPSTGKAAAPPPRPPPPYVPDPYARLSVESELTRPAVTATQARTYRHAELTATVGALFVLLPKLRLRVGPGLRRELLAPDEAGRVRGLLEAGLTLHQLGLVTVGPAPVRLEGTLDYVLLEPTAGREQQLRGSARLSIPIVPLLFLTAGIDLYAVERHPTGWGSSLDTTLGLRLHLDAAHQKL